MIRINLLPFRTARKKENVRRQISVFFLTFALIIIAVVYYNVMLSNKIKAMKIRNDATAAQITKYEKINKEIETIKKKLNQLNQKIQVIETLEGSRKDTIKLMESMTGLIIPERMWFTSLDANGENVAINGVALDERTIADFMVNLQKFYSNVTLKSLKQIEITSRSLNLKNFSLTLKNVQPQKAEPEKAKNS
jgi:type IV pilus assembly protein PilN